MNPSWSPDGTRIAYDSYSHNNRKREINVVDVHCVLQSVGCLPNPVFLVTGDYPDWSPDGEKILYRDIYRDGIYVVAISNPSEKVKVSQELNRCNSPQWSPDGAKIAFVCNETMYSVDPDGNNLVSLISGALYLKWTPDGKQIAFIGTETLDPTLGQSLDLEGMIGATAVFIMDADGKNVTRITDSNEESIGWFAWIPADNTETEP